MKVAILSNTAPFTVGAGTSHTAVNIARYFSNKNHEVHILSIANIKEKKFSGKIKVLTFKNKIFPDFSWSLLMYVLTSNYDRYILIGSTHLTFSLAMLFLKLQSKKLTFIPQWHLSHLFRNTFTQFLFKTKRLLFDYSVFKLVNPSTICYTKEEESYLKKFLTETFVVSLGGLNSDRPLWKFYDETQLPERKKSIILLYVGMIERGKLPLYIANVLKICSKEFTKKTVFYAVGPIEDDYISQLVMVLKKANVKNVIFTGPVSDSDLARYFKIADVFIFPSVSESFGLSLIEAVYAGVPVVATRTGIAPFLEKLGLILAVDYNDQRSMANKIYFSYKNSTAIRSKLNKHRSFISSHFRIDRFLSTLYEIVISK